MDGQSACGQPSDQMPVVHPSFLESMDPTLAVEEKKPSGQFMSQVCPKPPN